MRVQSLGLEDPLEKGITTHSSILAWRISETEEPGRLHSMGSKRVRHDWGNWTELNWTADWLKTDEYLKNHLICFSIELLGSSWICRTIVCCCSVTKSCLTLCNPTGRTTPGFSVLHCLSQFAQINVHWAGEAIQPSVTRFSFCLLSFPASGSFPMSQLFASGGQTIGTSASALILQ